MKIVCAEGIIEEGVAFSVSNIFCPRFLVNGEVKVIQRGPEDSYIFSSIRNLLFNKVDILSVKY